MGWRDDFSARELLLLDALARALWALRGGLGLLPPYRWSRGGHGLALFIEISPGQTLEGASISWPWPEELFAVPDPSTAEAEGGAVSRRARVWLAAQKRLCEPGEIGFHRLEETDRFCLEEADGTPVLNARGGRWFQAVRNAERGEGQPYPGAWRVLVEPVAPPDAIAESASAPAEAAVSWTCPTCRSTGFDPSQMRDRCVFCDGSFGGNPPTEEDIAEWRARPAPLFVMDAQAPAAWPEPEQGDGATALPQAEMLNYSIQGAVGEAEMRALHDMAGSVASDDTGPGRSWMQDLDDPPGPTVIVAAMEGRCEACGEQAVLGERLCLPCQFAFAYADTPLGQCAVEHWEAAAVAEGKLAGAGNRVVQKAQARMLLRAWAKSRRDSIDSVRAFQSVDWFHLVEIAEAAKSALEGTTRWAEEDDVVLARVQEVVGRQRL